MTLYVGNSNGSSLFREDQGLCFSALGCQPFGLRRQGCQDRQHRHDRQRFQRGALVSLVGVSNRGTTRHGGAQGGRGSETQDASAGNRVPAARETPQVLGGGGSGEKPRFW